MSNSIKKGIGRVSCFLLALTFLFSLASCNGKPTVTDDFAPPRAPEGFLDGRASVCVSVDDMTLLREILGGSDALSDYHISDKWSTSLSIDDAAGSLVYKTTTYGKGGYAKTTAYSLLEGGPHSYTVNEYLPLYFDRMPIDVKEEYENTGALISSYTKESTTACVLACIASSEAGRKIDESALKKLLSFSSDSEDVTDGAGGLRTASASFTCEEIAKMLEADGASEGLRAFFGSFIDDSDTFLSSSDKDKSTAEKIRLAGDLSFSVIITADANTNRIRIADIRAKGAGSIVSVVYDGASGNLEISSTHKMPSHEIKATYSTKHEDGRRVLEIAARESGALDSIPAGERTTEKKLKLTEEDGRVFFSSSYDSSDKFSGQSASAKDSHVHRQSSIAYDSKNGTFTLTGGDIQIKLTARDGALTGEAKNTSSGLSAELIFESGDIEGGRVHTLIKIKTAEGEADVSAAGVRFWFSENADALLPAALTAA